MTDFYSDYYDNDDLQRGYGRKGYGGISQVYIGTPHQRGHGIGSFLGGLFRRILPFIKSGAKVVGKEMLRSGINIANDVVERNVPLNEAFHTRVSESGKNLKRKAEEKINKLMHGSGYMYGKTPLLDHSVTDRSLVKTLQRPQRKRKRRNKASRSTRQKRKRSSKVKKRVKPRKTKKVKKAKKRRTVGDIFS